MAVDVSSMSCSQLLQVKKSGNPKSSLHSTSPSKSETNTIIVKPMDKKSARRKSSSREGAKRSKVLEESVELSAKGTSTNIPYSAGIMVRASTSRNNSIAPTSSAASPQKTMNGNKGTTITNSVHSDMSQLEHLFTQSQMKALKEAFDFFDIDRDGQITCSELNSVLKFLGNEVTDDDVRKMIDDVDVDGNGTVEFNEFLKMMNNYFNRVNLNHSEEDDMWETFKAFDHNGDNFIDFNEIKSTMHFLGESVSDEDVRSMIAEADVDQDGKIDFPEFKKMMSLMHQRAEEAVTHH